MDALSQDSMNAALAELPAWTRSADGRAIYRALRFDDFATAFGFMAAVALDAQALDHHPDWSNSWATVEISLTTHDAGGVTELDFELARRIDMRAAAVLGTEPG